MGALAVSALDVFNNDLIRENSFDAIYPMNNYYEQVEYYKQHESEYKQHESECKNKKIKMKKTKSYTDINLFNSINFSPININEKCNLIIQCVKNENIKIMLNFELVEKIVDDEKEYVIDQYGTFLNKV